MLLSISRSIMVSSGLALSSLLLAGPYSAQAEPSLDTVRKAMTSVAEVFASECSGANSQGTGFIYHNATTVVTALHVVSSCRTFQVFF